MNCEEKIKALEREKKNHEITSQLDAEAFSNALGELDDFQMARFQSTKNINLKGKTFNLLDPKTVDDGIEPEKEVQVQDLDSDNDEEIVRENDMPRDSFFQNDGVDLDQL